MMIFRSRFRDADRLLQRLEYGRAFRAVLFNEHGQKNSGNILTPKFALANVRC